MKKLFAAIVALALLCPSVFAQQKAPRLSGISQTNIGFVNNSTTSTVTLVPGVAGQYISLYNFIISLSSADTISLYCGPTQITANTYLSATSGLSDNLWPYYTVCGSGQSLNLVKGNASTPVGVTVWYTQDY